MKKLKSMSIKLKILVILAIGILILTVLFVLFSYHGFISKLENSMNETYFFALNSAGAELKQAFDDMHYCASKLTCLGGLSDNIKAMLLTTDSLEYRELHSNMVKMLVMEDCASVVIGRIDFFFQDSSYTFLSSDPSNEYAEKIDKPLFYVVPRTVFNIPRPSICGNDLAVLSLTRFVSPSDSGDYYLYLETDPGYLQSVFYPVLQRTGEHSVVCLTDKNGIVYYSTDHDVINLGTLFNQNVLSDSGYSLLSYPTEEWSIYLSVPSSEYNQIRASVLRQYILEFFAFVSAYVLLALILYRAVCDPLDAFLQELSGNDISGLYRKSIRKSKEYSLYSTKIESMREQICQLFSQVEAESIQKAQLESELLRSRINPHFLHNCLNRIQVLSSDSGYSTLAETINSLNHLMKYNLGRSKISTLREEISALDEYIQLSQGISYFIYEKKIEVPDQQLSIGMPRFILQPLAENCIKHNSNNANLKIILHIYNADGKLYISIADNGRGLEEKQLTEINQSMHIGCSQELGIGLAHVSEALRLSFMEKASIRMCANPSGGTIVQIVIEL